MKTIDPRFIILQAMYEKEEASGKCVATCEELGTAIQADTIDEARAIL